jgi:HK97 family phage portal protein
LKLKIFGKTFEMRSSSAGLPALSDDGAWMAYLQGRGHQMDATTAIKVAAVLRCCDVVAKTMASLPLKLLERTDTGDTLPSEEPLADMIDILPNKYTTAYSFWHMYVFNLMLTPGAYAKIQRDPNGFIIALWNIPTASVKERSNSANGEPYIDVWSNGTYLERLRFGEYMFTPGLLFTSSANPIDPIRLASDVLGLSTSLNAFAEDYFKNGSNLGGFVEYDESVSDEAYIRFKESWKETYQGVSNQHKWAFLESGFKVHQLTQQLKESQALESREFQVLEICRVLGVPPHKVFDLKRGTYNNIEQSNIEYVQETIAPMSVRIEQTIFKDLLTEEQRRKLFSKFMVNGLLRGDIATRTAYYNLMRQNGVLSANDIRQFEDLNKIPEADGGDAYLVNGNMISLASAKDNLPKSLQGKNTQV